MGPIDVRLRHWASVDQGTRHVSPEPNPCSVMPSAQFVDLLVGDRGALGLDTSTHIEKALTD